jgi:hypothetical protein
LAVYGIEAALEELAGSKLSENIETPVDVITSKSPGQ